MAQNIDFTVLVKDAKAALKKVFSKTGTHSGGASLEDITLAARRLECLRKVDAYTLDKTQRAQVFDNVITPFVKKCFECVKTLSNVAVEMVDLLDWFYRCIQADEKSRDKLTRLFMKVFFTNCSFHRQFSIADIFDSKIYNIQFSRSIVLPNLLMEFSQCFFFGVHVPC